MKKILIIGSGPVGAICADFITTSKKFNIELMDVAVSSRTKYKLKSDGLIPYKNINGNDFMYKRRDNLKFIFDKFTNFLTSHAQGGLSNVWGGNISALHNNKERYHVYNLGTGQGTTVLELIELFEKTNNVKVPYKFVDRREGDLEEVYCLSDKAYEELGWKTELTLEDICRDSWNYMITESTKRII